MPESAFMLMIREAQMRALDEIPRHQFQTQVIRHLQRFYPRECRLAGDEQLHRFVDLGIDRAAGHGFFSRQTVGLYINLMVMLGSHFDEDPQIPWAAKELDNGSAADSSRLLDGVFDRAADYLGQIAGDRNEHIVRAMVRLRKHDFRAAVRSSPEEAFEDALWIILMRLYPEKADCQGRPVTMALARSAIAEAESFALRGDQPLGLYCVLSFMLGSGFHSDPLYGWARQILVQPALAHDTKFERLLTRSLAYLEDSLRD
jgi:hypothetical protein